MAITNGILCIDGGLQTVNFSGQSISTGSFITATNGTDPDPLQNTQSCFEIYAGDEPSGDFTASTESYTSCYECLVNNYTIVSLVDCLTSSLTLNVDISQFGYIPALNSVIFGTITSPIGSRTEGTYTDCFTISDIQQYSENEYVNTYEPDLSTIDQIIHSNYSLENGCNECLNGFSAGTEYNSCNICWDGTGYTSTIVSPPHPTWTNGQGQVVVQLNAVALGGPNGLNN